MWSFLGQASWHQLMVRHRGRLGHGVGSGEVQVEYFPQPLLSASFLSLAHCLIEPVIGSSWMAVEDLFRPFHTAGRRVHSYKLHPWHLKAAPNRWQRRGYSTGTAFSLGSKAKFSWGWPRSLLCLSHQGTRRHFNCGCTCLAPPGEELGALFSICTLSSLSVFFFF